MAWIPLKLEGLFSAEGLETIGRVSVSRVGAMVYPPLPDRIPPSMPRPKGSKNRTTIQAKEAIAEVLSGRVEDLDAWIGQVAQTDPYRAFQMVVELCKLTIPKVRQNESNGPVPAPVILMSKD